MFRHLNYTSYRLDVLISLWFLIMDALLKIRRRKRSPFTQLQKNQTILVKIVSFCGLIDILTRFMRVNSSFENAVGSYVRSICKVLHPKSDKEDYVRWLRVGAYGPTRILYHLSPVFFQASILVSCSSVSTLPN